MYSHDIYSSCSQFGCSLLCTVSTNTHNTIQLALTNCFQHHGWLIFRNRYICSILKRLLTRCSQYGSAHAQQSSQRVLIQWNNIVIQQTTKSTAYSVNFHPIMADCRFANSSDSCIYTRAVASRC